MVERKSVYVVLLVIWKKSVEFVSILTQKNNNNERRKELYNQNIGCFVAARIKRRDRFDSDLPRRGNKIEVCKKLRDFKKRDQVEHKKKITTCSVVLFLFVSNFLKQHSTTTKKEEGLV